jgi:hypothetical protein
VGGCTEPGPDCGETKSPAEGLPGQSLGGASPVAKSTGTSSGKKKIEGWPRAIAWDEFKEIKTRPAGVDEDAQIHSETAPSKNVTVVRKGGQFRLGPLKAEVHVVPGDTWVVAGKQSDELLSHEQGHYDITGLTGRDLLRDLAAIRAPTVKALQRRVQKTIQRTRKLANALTTSYDDETKHGTDKVAQKKWKDHLRKCIKDGIRLSAGP